MVAQGAGTVMFMTSGAAYAPPFAMPGKGGWGFAYTVSKGGFHRMAIQLAYEYAAEGLRAFNVQPGFVATERVKLTGGPVANIAAKGVEPAVVGAAVAHIAGAPRRLRVGFDRPTPRRRSGAGPVVTGGLAGWAREAVADSAPLQYLIHRQKSGACSGRRRDSGG